MIFKSFASLFITMGMISVAVAQEPDLTVQIPSDPLLNQQPPAEPVVDLYKDAFTIIYSGKGATPSLNEVKVKGQIFLNHMPLKKFEAKTNEEGKFLLDKDYGPGIALDLFYIEGQEQLRVKCNGNAIPGKKDLNVKCERMKRRLSRR